MESLGVVVGGHGCRLQVPDEEAPKQMPSPVNMGPWLVRGRVLESVRRSVMTWVFSNDPLLRSKKPMHGHARLSASRRVNASGGSAWDLRVGI